MGRQIRTPVAVIDQGNWWRGIGAGAEAADRDRVAEQAFLALTGTPIRDERADGADLMHGREDVER
jgi:hypothetical protein